MCFISELGFNIVLLFFSFTHIVVGGVVQKIPADKVEKMDVSFIIFLGILLATVVTSKHT